MEDVLREIIELYLRRAGVKELVIEETLFHDMEIKKLLGWLNRTIPIEQLNGVLDDYPLEW